jgi:hypothetical protein
MEPEPAKVLDDLNRSVLLFGEPLSVPLSKRERERWVDEQIAS